MVLFAIILMVLVVVRFMEIPTLMSDSFTYMATADGLHDGKGYLEEWGRGPLKVPLFYPGLIFLVMSLTGEDPENIGLYISVMANLVLLAVMFIWIGRTLGWIWAWLVALLVVSNPSLTYYSRAVLTESLFTLFFALGVIVIWRIISQRQQSPIFGWLGPGLLIGAGALTKYPGIVLLIATLGSMIWKVVLQQWAIKRCVIGGSILLATFLIVIMPASLFSKIPGGGGEHSGKKTLVSFLSIPDARIPEIREKYTASLNPEGNQFLVETDQGLTLGQLLRDRGGEILSLEATNAAMAFGGILRSVPWWILIWIPVGVMIQWVRRDHRSIEWAAYITLILLLFIGFYVLAMAFTSSVGSDRYVVPLIPVLLLWSVMGMHSVAEGIRTSWERMSMVHAIVAPSMITVVIVLLTIPAVRSESILHENEAKTKKTLAMTIGTWIESHYGSGQKIMVREPSIPYYAKGEWVLTPYESLDRIVAFAQEKGVRCLIVRRSVEGQKRPQMAVLLDKEAKPEGLVKIVGLQSRHAPTLLEMAIYEVVPKKTGKP